jgi:Zn finger protein HypA/HybF involved in hydrogenase expression
MSSRSWCSPVHEVSLVGALVEACERVSGGAPVRRVRVRHATSIPEAAVRQAFALLTPGTPLAGASLQLEPFEIELRCDCGYAGPLLHDELGGAPYVLCPACDRPASRPPTPELELVAVEAARPA